MKKIPLTQGKVALVDDDDYDYLKQWKWHYHSGYAARTYKTIRMHRVILHAKVGQEVDHINRNPLDNRRVNLRLATRSLNCRNRTIHKNNTSGQKGVHFNQSKKHWTGRIQVNKKRYFLGNFKTKNEAIMAYHKAEMEFASC